MIHYIKQNFLPRDISLLTRTTINGSGSGEQVFLIFSFHGQALVCKALLLTGNQRDACPNIWSRLIPTYPLLSQKPHGPHWLAWKISLSFPTIPLPSPTFQEVCPTSLFSNMLPFLAGFPTSFLPSSSPSFSFSFKFWI